MYNLKINESYTNAHIQAQWQCMYEQPRINVWVKEHEIFKVCASESWLVRLVYQKQIHS